MTIVDEQTLHPGAAAVRPQVRALRPYRLPAASAYAGAPVRLHQNESGEDWPADVKEEIARRLVAEPWNRYPGMRAAGVAAAIAELQGTPAEMVTPTAGSNEALRAAFAAFAAGGTVVMPVPTFSMAKTLAVLAGARVVEVPLAGEFALDTASLLHAAHATRAEVIYLANPNNPPGNRFPDHAVRQVIEGAPGIVLLDEAYWEFTSGSWLPVVERAPRLVLARTFSKAMAAAGVRLGWLTAQPPVIAELAKVSPPYGLNVFAQIAAPVLVAHRHLAAARVRVVVAERERVASGLRAMGAHVYPSETNFLLFEPPAPPAAVWEGLAAAGVLVRDVSGIPQLGACLRVSIGTPEDNSRFLEALAAVLAGGAGARP
ncbi:MAG: aminotransferase class I/II-fold pyridoxal phosphate-dependent enzyme [Armatimonadota bacterium]|nr:aminotransferase class I/II-fold pyridoxal phosphate-dependent enzyme [Armatimonadota bacterium]MDR7420886.1 aminotransferase class I/II-fold pyridoxal phosphate-dependent enzyme [Armatimonadota bacterium]MDR7454763.1 aminotransferase class I/II-fold pyridoxal phosphate-dependent enzyme [Armatimonadota bacterium]MDR7456643.1 aminotransferase class I/II-fold pyridoxal phosphate-dependent enzyme [Armatimonadota bacterium]MDR7495547.1 aminotransferase class I/II-fold pyridoxal phosphate-depende